MAAAKFERMCRLTTGPSSARTAAGSSSAGNGREPKRRCAAIQPSTAPGTVTLSPERGGIRSRPRARKAAWSMPAGARPEASSAYVGPPAALLQKAPPPALHRAGHHERGAGGDGGIEGVAAALEDVETDRRRRRVRRRNHALHTQNRTEAGQGGHGFIAPEPRPSRVRRAWFVDCRHGRVGSLRLWAMLSSLPPFRPRVIGSPAELSAVGSDASPTAALDRATSASISVALASIDVMSPLSNV